MPRCDSSWVRTLIISMSGFGTKRTCRDVRYLSAFGAKRTCHERLKRVGLTRMTTADMSSVPDALLWLSDIARQAVMCCARPTITRPGRSMSAALELRSQA
jgi:hypothetical protein